LNAPPYSNFAYAIRRFKKTASDFSSLTFTTKSPSKVTITDPNGKVLSEIPNTTISSDSASVVSSATIGTPVAGEYSVIVSSNESAVPLAVHASNRTGELQLKVFEQKNIAKQNLSLSYKFIYNPDSSTSQLKLGVVIDIEPHVKNNVGFCDNSSLIIPVAVLGSNTFDVSQIDDGSVAFSGAKNLLLNPITKKAFHLIQDINRDGKPDAVFNFMLKNTNLLCSSTKGVLTGTLKDGMVFEGSDNIRMMFKAKPGK
ncbi:MAG: hypothetical protein WBO77_01610, partial [Microgenomates group bacterium]